MRLYRSANDTYYIQEGVYSRRLGDGMSNRMQDKSLARVVNLKELPKDCIDNLTNLEYIQLKANETI